MTDERSSQSYTDIFNTYNKVSSRETLGNILVYFRKSKKVHMSSHIFVKGGK